MFTYRPSIFDNDEQPKSLADFIAYFKTCLTPFISLEQIYGKYVSKEENRKYYSLGYIDMHSFCRIVKGGSPLEIGLFLLYLQYNNYNYNTYFEKVLSILLEERFGNISLLNMYLMDSKTLENDKRTMYAILLLVYIKSPIHVYDYNIWGEVKPPDRIDRKNIKYVYDDAVISFNEILKEQFGKESSNELDLQTEFFCKIDRVISGKSVSDEKVDEKVDENDTKTYTNLVSFLEKFLNIDRLMEYNDITTNSGQAVQTILNNLTNLTNLTNLETNYDTTKSDVDKLKDLKWRIDRWHDHFRLLDYFNKTGNNKFFHKHPFSDIVSIMDEVKPNKDTVFEVIKYMFSINPCGIYVLPLIEYYCTMMLDESPREEEDLKRLVHLYGLGVDASVRRTYRDFEWVERHTIAKFIPDEIKISLIEFLIELIGEDCRNDKESECSFVTDLVRFCTNIEIHLELLCTTKHTSLKLSLLHVFHRDDMLDKFTDYLIENVSPDTFDALIHTVKCCLIRGYETQVIKFTDNGFDISVKNNYLARYAYCQYKHNNQCHMFLLVSQYVEIFKYIKDSCKKDFKYNPTRSCKEGRLSIFCKKEEL
jgi:hypothetical protein